MSRILAQLLGVLGLLGLAFAFVNLQEAGGTHPYPGWQALIPTLAGMLLIAGGIGPAQTLVGRALSLRPLQFVGDLSYSWYLWHFPVLILGGIRFGTESPLVTTGLVVLSFVAAWLSFSYVETPLRSLPTLAVSSGRSLAFGGALVAAAAVSALVLPTLGPSAATTVTALDGSRVLLRPSPETASSDYVSMRDVGCDLDFEEVDMPACDFADTTSGSRVVLLGDSHAVVLFPPLQRASERLGWRLNNWTKSACPIADVTIYNQGRERVFTECDEFRSMILDRVVEQSPDVVVISNAVSRRQQAINRGSGTLLSAEDSRPVIVAGLRGVLERLTAAGIRVVLTVDPPASPFDPPTCLAETADVASCGFTRSRVPGPERAAAAGVNGVELLDFSDQICTRRACSPVMGDILVYRDTNHLTKTFALTLTRRLGRLLTG